jgi:hypothetical protein
MLAALTAFAAIMLFDAFLPKEPPSKAELAAITERGRELAGYDAAAWHASDAVQAKQPKEGSVVRYIARKVDKKWTVAFGRLDEKGEAFVVAYEAIEGEKPGEFDVSLHSCDQSSPTSSFNSIAVNVIGRRLTA